MSEPDTERQVANQQIVESNISKGAILLRAVKYCLNAIHHYVASPLCRPRDNQKSNNPPTEWNAHLKESLPLLERAGQCCFLCLSKPLKQFATTVPCLRPTRPRAVKSTRTKLNGAILDKVYHKMRPREGAHESDADVFERLRWACFEHHGRWKRWLPFYGITRVEEVHVRDSNAFCLQRH